MTETRSISRMIEGIIFAAKSPMTINNIMEYLPEDTATDSVNSILVTLKETFADNGFTLVNTGKHWAFRTHPNLGDILAKTDEEERPLSRAAMEMLSIIAYHQPATRAEIENIRGVAVSKGTLDILMEAEWIKPGRRRQVVGKPMTWVTTPYFLDHFGLENLNALPGMEELKASGLLDTRTALETLSLFTDTEGVEEETYLESKTS